MGVQTNVDFSQLKFEFGDKGGAYDYFGRSRKTPWDSKALEIAVLGSQEDINRLKQLGEINLESAMKRAIIPSSGYILGNVSFLVNTVTDTFIPEENLQDKIRRISTRGASFDNMPVDEQLEELNNVLENMLKQDGKFVKVDYDDLFMGIVQIKDGTNPIKKFRNETQVFRHASEQGIREREAMPISRKKALVQLGVLLATRVNKQVQDKKSGFPF